MDSKGTDDSDARSFYLKIFGFFEVKFSIYLNRRVFVMLEKMCKLYTMCIHYSNGFTWVFFFFFFFFLRISNTFNDLTYPLVKNLHHFPYSEDSVRPLQLSG